MKIFALLGILLISLASCGKEQETDPWPYVLVEVEQDNGVGDTFQLPVRFDPATGEYAAVCGETEHGEECPFWSEKYYDPRFTVWRDTLFWVKDPHTSEKAVLYAFDLLTLENRQVTELEHVSQYRILGEYLFIDSHPVTKRICLPDWTEMDSPSPERPDWVMGDTGYYMIKGVRGGEGGLYRQTLYEAGNRPPVKELLFADAVVRVVWYGEDAVFWLGNSSYREDENHLYRYDLRTRTNTVLQENFDGSICVADGEWLYSVADDVLWRIHRETGRRMLLYEPDGLKLASGYNRIQEAGGYLIMEAVTTDDAKVWGRLVCHPDTGETVFWPYPE